MVSYLFTYFAFETKTYTPMKKKEDKTIIGHIGVIGPQMLTRRRKRQRVLSVEEKDRLRAQARAAYEIRITPTTRVSY